MGFRIVYADEVHDSSSDQLAAIIKKQVGKSKAYLTFDIDCLDPSVAPGTGTPIPGGMSYHQAASIIRKLTDVNFVAMDVVEVSPPYDHAEITATRRCVPDHGVSLPQGLAARGACNAHAGMIRLRMIWDVHVSESRLSDLHRLIPWAEPKLPAPLKSCASTGT